MSRNKIQKLTLEQEALIIVYAEKWKQIMLSSQPIDRNKCRRIIKQVYKLINLPEPQILFCDNQYDAAYGKIEELENQLGEELAKEYLKSIDNYIWNTLVERLWWEIGETIIEHLQDMLNDKIRKYIEISTNDQSYRYSDFSSFDLQALSILACYFDYCISALIRYMHVIQSWLIFESLVKNCGIFDLCKRVAIICDRPI